MIDPYGDDLEDLSVLTFVEGTLETVEVILHSQKGGDWMKLEAPASTSIKTEGGSLT